MSHAPKVGQGVLYRIGGTDSTPELRPATVIRVWSPTLVQLAVIPDGTNDRSYEREPGVPMFAGPEMVNLAAWRTSVHEGLGIGQWRQG